jgi:iron complex transport system permease protein
MNPSKNISNQKRLGLTLYILLSLAVLILCPLHGSETLNLKTIAHDITTNQAWSVDTQIFVLQRLPRITLGFIVGGILALVGSVFQVMLRNPLATPYTLGVMGGASLGAFIAFSVPGLYFAWGPFSSIQLLSLAGAAIVFILIYIISYRGQQVTTNTLLLAGVTIGILCGSLTMLVRYLTNPNMLVSMDRWLMGRLDIVGFQQIIAILPFAIIGAAAIIANAGALNLFSLGQDMAAAHGVNVRRTIILCFAGGSMATAAAVSVAGPIGFIGLIIPHVVKKLSGYDHRIVLPASFLAGGSFLVICDTVARTAISPTEMPVGIITAIVGSPFFIYLLTRNK